MGGGGFTFALEAKLLIKRNQMLLAGQNDSFSTLLLAVGDHLTHDALRVASVTVERMGGNGQQHEPSAVEIILLVGMEHIVCQVNSNRSFISSFFAASVL